MHASLKRTLAAVAVAAIWTTSTTGQAGAAADAKAYPRTIVAQAKTDTNGTVVMSKITIHIDRLMEPSRRTRVLDALKYDGYQGFMEKFRPLPVIGTVKTPNREVNVKYAWETPVETKTRLVVVSDKPLFFLPADNSKPKAGFELTFVELLFDAKGAATGTMSGASRVKPSPDGIVLEEFAVAPVELTVAAPPRP